MKNCQRCGAQLPDDASFCFRCGQQQAMNNTTYLPTGLPIAPKAYQEPFPQTGAATNAASNRPASPQMRDNRTPLKKKRGCFVTGQLIFAWIFFFPIMITIKAISTKKKSWIIGTAITWVFIAIGCLSTIIKINSPENRATQTAIAEVRRQTIFAKETELAIIQPTLNMENTLAAKTQKVLAITKAYEQTKTSEALEKQEATEAAIQATEQYKQTQRAITKYPIQIELDCIWNIFLNKYNIDIYVDDKKIGVLKHGEADIYKVELLEGKHKVTLTKENSRSINGTIEFSVPEDALLQYKLNCSSEHVEVAMFTTAEKTESAEKTIAVEKDIAKKSTQAMEETVAMETAVVYEQTKSAQQTSIAETSVVVRQTKFAQQTITASEAIAAAQKLEETFPLEKAKRVAVVSMTNAYALDVLAADGNTNDPSLYHSYADTSGYYMTVYSDGIWSAKNENAWRVDDMKLKNYGSGFCAKVSADINFNGTNYIVSNVRVVTGKLENLDSSDPNKIGIDEMEPSDFNSFLTVSPDLIRDDRKSISPNDTVNYDTTPTKNIIGSISSEREQWINKQFSLWNGAHKDFEKIIIRNLNDEKSYKHINTTYIDIINENIRDVFNLTLENGGYSQRVEVGDLFIETEFSSKNVFNATIKNKALGIASYKNNTISLVDIE